MLTLRFRAGRINGPDPHEEGLPAERTILCEVAHTALPYPRGRAGQRRGGDCASCNDSTTGPATPSTAASARCGASVSAGDSSVWVSCGACIDAGRRGRFGTALTVNVPIQPGRAGVSRCFGYVVCLSSEQAHSAL